MKNKVKLLSVALIYTIGALSITACGSSTENHEHDASEEHQHTDDEMHSDEMHSDGNMEMSDAINIMNCPLWENGEHDHSAYICPMWEVEGELEAAGDCPKCGMVLVAFEDVKEQHAEQNPDHEGHDHEH